MEGSRQGSGKKDVSDINKSSSKNPSDIGQKDDAHVMGLSGKEGKEGLEKGGLQKEGLGQKGGLSSGKEGGIGLGQKGQIPEQQQKTQGQTYSQDQQKFSGEKVEKTGTQAGEKKGQRNE